MIRILLAAMTLFVLIPVSAAQARHHHQARHQAANGLDPLCNIIMPCEVPKVSTPRQRREARGRYVARQMGGFGAPRKTSAAPVRAPARRVQIERNPAPARFDTAHYADHNPFGSNGVIGRPARFIAGRLVCAINVGAALAERGIKGTGSALALSYDHWGHRSAPVPGAVAVSNRRGGGHVAIVSRVEGRRVFVWNATGGRRGWREIEYTNRRARYRVAG